jgi:endonuclease YncB( thermonuclease family)
MYRYVRVEAHGTGLYGRTIGTIYGLDGTNWNKRTVERGYAFATKKEQDQWKKRNNLS